MLDAAFSSRLRTAPVVAAERAFGFELGGDSDAVEDGQCGEIAPEQEGDDACERALGLWER
jgi:hypothetical protein